MRVLQLQRGQNREARSILTSLTAPLVSNISSAAPAKAPVLDGYLHFLQALCLQSLGHSAQAIQACVSAVNDKPLLWSAWKLLVTLCSDRDIISGLQLNKHWARLFFDAEVALEAQQTSLPAAANSSTSYVEDHFPKSTHTLACRAVVAYNNRDFDTAQTLFETLRERDPHRLEQMDTFSNILYIREQRPSLSFLAHAAHKEDKYRPETCCIVGNYYSLKGDHEKALVYFRRALRLNPVRYSTRAFFKICKPCHNSCIVSCSFLCFPELFSSMDSDGSRVCRAAQYASRHRGLSMRCRHQWYTLPSQIPNFFVAIQYFLLHSARDYRAWYGLGQTYEILQMHSHSLFYFSKAAALRPYDPRLWCALAESFEKLDRIDDAIKCYLRAEGNQDREGIALLRLAKLHAQLSGFENRDKAAEYYKRVLSRDQGTLHNISGSDAIEARMFLAQHARNRGKFDEAITLCQELMDCGGATRDAAKVLLSEVRQMMTSK
jgi:anaphase-promoting complex subunit 8